MSRKRMIDPGIWTDDGFISLTHAGRCLFVGMFSHADDEGRGAASLQSLKAKIFPADDMSLDTVKALLESVAHHMRVTLYAVDGVEYYQLDRWKEHQFIKDRKPSTIPPFYGPASDRERTGVGPASVPNEYNESMNNRRPTAVDAFDEWWTGYPKKAAKADALRAWNARLKEGVTVELLTTALRNYVADIKRKRTGIQYILNGSTFLGPRERWKDYLGPVQNKPDLGEAKMDRPKCKHCGEPTVGTETICLNCHEDLRDGAI